MNAQRFSFPFFLGTLILLGIKSYSQQDDSTYYYYNQMLHPAINSDIPLAIQYYTVQAEKHLSQNNNYGAIAALRMIAIGQLVIGNTYDSESTSVQAITLIENSPHTDTLIESRKGLYNQLGHIYRATEQPEKAIEAYDMALKFSQTTKDSLTLINNKATIYKDSKKHEKALEQLELALGNKNTEKYPSQLAMLLDNMGYVQSKLNNPNALHNLNKALQLRDSLKDLKGIYSTNKSLALYYHERDQKALAQKFADKAYAVAKSLNSLTFLEDALSLFADIGDGSKFAEFKIITDSIAKQKQMAQNKNAFLKYNIEKEKKNTVEALLEKEKQKSQKLLFLIVALAVTIGSSYVFVTLRKRHKKEKIAEVNLTETRISKKVHDEVANDIYQMMAKLQSRQMNESELLDDLEKVYNKTRDISKENSAIEIQEDFNGQLNDLLLGYKDETVNILTRNNSLVDWSLIPSFKKISVYKVLQELMTNMKKHSEASVVVLNFHQTKNKISIEYSDNGKGCDLKNKNGLINAENRISAINGTLTFDSEPGKGFRSLIKI